MIDLVAIDKIYLYSGFTNMRCGLKKLTLKVASSFNITDYSRSLFIFCGRNKKSIKILEVTSDGTWLYQKYFSNGRFKWSKDNDEKIMNLTIRQLRWLLDGLSIVQSQASKEHSEVILY